MAFPLSFASSGRGAGPRPRLLVVLLAGVLAACGSEDPAGPEEESGDLGLSTTRLAFEPHETEHVIELENRGVASVPWSVETNQEWLLVSPASGTLAPGQTPVSVRLLRQLLGLGTHAAEVRFLLGVRTFTVAITAVNTGVALARIEPESLRLGPDDSAAAVTLSNHGEAPLSWSLAGPSWVTIEPAGGSVSPDDSVDVSLTVDRSGLQDGVSTAALPMSSNGGEPTVTLVVEVASPAELTLSPAVLDLGSSSTNQTTGVANTGGRPLTWSASGGAPWAVLSRTSGTVNPHTLQPVLVTVTREGLADGPHETRFTIASNGGTQDLVVRLRVGSSPPPPPPPPPPPGGSVALEGRVVDQFSGAGMSGLTVRFAGTATTTDGTGHFTIPGDPSTSLRSLELEGSQIHTRRTFARSDDDRWEAIPSSFAIAPFDDVAREYEPRTIRWTQNPQVYIDTQAHNFPGGGPVPQAWIDEVRNAIPALISDWSSGVLQAASVTETSSPPSEGTPGAIVIAFDEDPNRYSSPQAVGLTRTFWTSQRAISGVNIWLRFNGVPDATGRRTIFAHELGHGMGMGHRCQDCSPTTIMWPRVAINLGDLTTFDRRAGDIVYSRSPGNSSPDTDSQSTFLGALAPAGLPAGSYEWVCGAEGVNVR